VKRVARLALWVLPVYVGALLVIWVGAEFLPVDQPTTQAEPHVVAIVFFTDDPESRKKRVEAGVRHLQTVSAHWLVLTGGYRPDRDYHGALEMQHLAVSLGVSNVRILTDQSSNDSRSNLRQAIEAIEAKGIPDPRLVFVSDRFHLLRLSWIASRLRLRHAPRLAPTDETIWQVGGLRRLNHELVGYILLAFPEAWTKPALAWMRRI
jgi:uncharacterized SAM-binding protein YcdF (DUF218 family)